MAERAEKLLIQYGYRDIMKEYGQDGRVTPPPVAVHVIKLLKARLKMLRVCERTLAQIKRMQNFLKDCGYYGDPML